MAGNLKATTGASSADKARINAAYVARKEWLQSQAVPPPAAAQGAEVAA